MLSGDANFAGIAGPAIISNVIGGGDVIQAAAVVKTFTIPIYSQPSIKVLADLKGQKVGVSRFGAVTHITALSVLEKAGIAKDVTIIQTGGIPKSSAALTSGAIAAATVLPPQSLMLKDEGFRELVGLKELKELNIPFVAYFDNQYIEALEKEGFLKKLWP